MTVRFELENKSCNNLPFITGNQMMNEDEINAAGSKRKCSQMTVTTIG